MYKTITIGTLFQKDNIETLGKLKSLRVVGTLREGRWVSYQPAGHNEKQC